jgi:hypothetical protein
MALLILGIALLIIASVMDYVFRTRMNRAGDKTAILLGGAFDYRKYHAVRKKYGWPAWPVYLMWAVIILGLLLVGIGCFQAFGFHPRR